MYSFMINCIIKGTKQTYTANRYKFKARSWLGLKLVWIYLHRDKNYDVFERDREMVALKEEHPVILTNPVKENVYETGQQL